MTETGNIFFRLSIFGPEGISWLWAEDARWEITNIRIIKTLCMIVNVLFIIRAREIAARDLLVMVVLFVVKHFESGLNIEY